MIRKLQWKALLLFTILCGSSTVHAQATVEWSRTYGGNGADRGHCIKQIADGGFVVSGYTDTSNNGDVTGYSGGGDIWVLKLNSAGELEWQNAYGGTGSEPFTEAYSHIIETPDGGYLVTGESNSSNGDLTENHGNLDLWVFKINSQGTIEWQKSLGGSVHEGAYSILQEPDGGFVLVGYTSSNDGDVSGNHGITDGWIIKLSATGDIVWQKLLGGSWTDALSSIQHTNDGGYIAGGYTLSNDGDLEGLNPDGFGGYADFWVVKLNSDAEIEWQSVIGGTGKDWGRCIIPADDGGYVIAGDTESENGDVSEHFGDYDWWVVKVNATGAIEWEKSLGGTDREELNSVTAAADGSGFYMVGTTESADGHVTDNNGGKDVWLIKLNYSGDVILNQCFGGSENEEGYFGTEATDGKFVIAARANSDDGDVNENTQGEDVWIFKLNTGTLTNDYIVGKSQFYVYPNPADSTLWFSESLKKVEIHSVTGQMLMQNFDVSHIEIGSLPNGAYLVKAQKSDGTDIAQTIIKK